MLLYIHVMLVVVELVSDFVHKGVRGVFFDHYFFLQPKMQSRGLGVLHGRARWSAY